MNRAYFPRNFGVTLTWALPLVESAENELELTKTIPAVLMLALPERLSADDDGSRAMVNWRLVRLKLAVIVMPPAEAAGSCRAGQTLFLAHRTDR